MATLEELVVKLTADTEDLKAQLSTSTKITQKAANDMQKAISEFADKSSQKTSFFQSAMATMTGFLAGAAVQGAFRAVKEAAGFVADQLIEGVHAAEAQENAMIRLTVAMQATGKYTKTTAKEMDDFASQMEMTTGVADDLVLSSLAVLSTMTKLNTQGLQGAQKAALDLSVAMGIDLESATRAVGKAINGSADALKRYGVEVQVGGDKTANLSKIIDALPTGAAAAKMNTFGGALLGVRNAWGNVAEAVANAVTHNEVFIKVMQAASQMLGQFETYLKNNAAQVRDGLGQAFIDLLGAVQSTFSGLSTFFQYANAGFQSLSTGLTVVIRGFFALGQLIDGNTADAQMNFDKIIESANNTNKAFEDIGKDTFLDKGAALIGTLKDTAQGAFDEMKGSAIEAAIALDAPKKKIIELTEAQKAHNEVVKSFAQTLAGEATAIDGQYKFLEQLQKNTLEQQMISAEDDYQMQLELQSNYFQQKTEAMLTQQALEQDTLNQARAQGLITETEYHNAVLALNQKAALAQQQAATDKQKFEADKNKERASNFNSTMGVIAGLASSGNKELAAIGKAAAVTQATIDGYAAVQKALASAPPPFNFALAGLVGVATAANVAKIAGVGLNKGSDSVPGIGNTDSVPAMLTPGERVVPQKTNQDLTNYLKNQDQGSGKNMTVNINVNVAPGTGVSKEQAGDIMQGLRDYVAAGGLAL